MADVDVFYHFAAPVGGREKIESDPLFNAESLAIDTFVFQFLARLKLGKRLPVLVYPSSSAVYPIRFQIDPAIFKSLEERDQLITGNYHQAADLGIDGPMWGVPDEMYGFTKLVGEKLAYTAAKYGINTLCIRPFSGYGEGQGPDYPMTALVRRALANEDPFVVWGSGQQVRDWIHVDDIVGAVQARLAAGVEGYTTLNISTGIPTSFTQLAARIRESVGGSYGIVADSSKPEGVRYRVGDPTELNRYFTPKVTLAEGIARVIEYERKLSAY